MGKINSQIEVKGIVISSGISMGAVCHYQSGSIEQSSYYNIINPELIKKEIEKFNKAIKISKIELESLAKSVEKTIGKNEAMIFETHKLILEDKALINKIVAIVKDEKVNIEHAVKTVFEEFENKFSQMDDEYLKERGTDFSEIKRRILSHLTGNHGHFMCDLSCSTKNKHRIIMTHEFTPSMISMLEDKNVCGFITTQGGKNSHAALLARAIELPYITGIDIIDQIKCGALTIIDGIQGKVIFNPDTDTIIKYKNLIEKNNEALSEEIINYENIFLTKNGNKIEILANIININEIKFLEEYNLSGIGLVRTEFFFFDYDIFPTFEEQTELYARIINEADGKPVTFRLFDIGGDKKLKSLKFDSEENPLLGLRGIRFLMKNKKILEDQIKAICLAGHHGEIKILYPMISNIKELDAINDVVQQIIQELKITNKIKLGMMFEVPSVFIDPIPFLKKVDFISIGTNDLVQYLFGIDRNNANVSYLYNQDEPAVYKLIQNLVEKAKEYNVEVSLCGEINFETNFLENIIQLGVSKISITPVIVPKLINRLKNL